jgi:hypothetical protein
MRKKLWKTRESVPFREFMQKFDPDQDRAESAEQTLWARRKFLVYDGQQRLQTLYSCLHYTFAGQALCFDLFFDPNTLEDYPYGFSFKRANTTLDDCFWPHRVISLRRADLVAIGHSVR